MNTAKAMGDFIGVGKSTVAKIEKVKKQRPEALKDIADGKTSANNVLKEIGGVLKKPKKKGTKKPVLNGNLEGDITKLSISKVLAEVDTCVNSLTSDKALDPRRYFEQTSRIPNPERNNREKRRSKVAFFEVGIRWVLDEQSECLSGDGCTSLDQILKGFYKLAKKSSQVSGLSLMTSITNTLLAN